MRWQKTRDEQLKAKLLQYNLDDCEALMGVVLCHLTDDELLPAHTDSTRRAERTVTRRVPINVEIYGNPLQCRTNCGTKQHSTAVTKLEGKHQSL
jgi:hypothetical protein